MLNPSSLQATPDLWEQVRLEFIAEHEAGHQPTLEAFAARYPQFASELTEFVFDYLHMENAVARHASASSETAGAQIVREPSASYAVSVLEQTLAALGLPAGNADGTTQEDTAHTSQTRLAPRKARS